MKEVTNPFVEGDRVICISDRFPIIPKYSGDSTIETERKPTIGDVLIIDEILGDFVRFDQYDSDSFNWWYWDRFARIDKALDEIKNKYPLTDEDDLIEFIEEITVH